MSRPLPMLSNMPWNVKQDIVNKVDYMTRFSLRKCSRDLRDIIDTSRIHYYTLDIRVDKQNVTLNISPDETMKILSIKYIEDEEDSCLVEIGNKKKQVKGYNYIQRAVLDWATFLKSPKSSLRMLIIREIPGSSWKDRTILLTCLKSTLKKFPQKLNIHTLAFFSPSTQKEVLHVLPYLKPGVLEEIYIENKTRELDQLVNTEHWRMAERVELIKESNIRIQDLLHLKSIDISKYRLIPEEMPLLIQAFLSRYKKNPRYRIGLPDNYDRGPLENWLNEHGTCSDRYDNVWYSKIPGTEFHLFISLQFNLLELWRELSTDHQN